MKPFTTLAATVIAATLLCGLQRPAVAAAAAGNATQCAPEGDLSFVCGLINVEDFLPVAGGAWLVGGSYQAGSAGLYLIDTAAKTFKPVALSVAAKLDPRYDCPAPDLKGLVTHGLDVADTGAGTGAGAGTGTGTGTATGTVTVYAVNHGGRESIEVFRLHVAQASAEWVGCVVLPPGAVGNSVASLSDGGFVVTKFLDSSDKEAFQHILAGRINGVVYLWRPGKGFSEVPGTKLSGDNGILVSRDGNWVFVNAYGSHEIYRVPLSGRGAQTHVKVAFNPDNLRWAPDDQILVTGQFMTAQNATARHGWATARLDPTTMTVTPVLQEPGGASFDDATSAVQVGNTLWFGTFRGDRVAYRSVRAGTSDGPPTAEGSRLYEQFCGSCHEHPRERIPPREVIARRSADEVMQVLSNGAMRTQAAGLNMNDRVAVATFLTGSAPTGNLGKIPEANRCTQSAISALPAGGSSWNGWGRDLDNSRFQPQPGLTADQVPRLRVKWAFGYRATYVYGQPTVVGGRVYVTSSSGRVYSLDAKTGCTYWTFDAAGPVRTAVSVVEIARGAVVFGDDDATVYALNVSTGELLWKRQLDNHPDARITGAPVFYGGRLYVPVSSLEELAAAAAGYECCKFRGSVVALEADTGRVVWQTYIISEPARPYRKSPNGTQLFGPAGGAVWSAPTLDPKRNLLYVGTGNSYTDVPTTHTDSVMALEMTSGAIRWVNQLRQHDNYVVPCDSAASAGKGACPQVLGPDADFGTSPILRRQPGGREILLTGAKSGQIYGLDPASGRQLWAAQVGVGSSLGGLEWGGAADRGQMYAAISDAAAAKPGGLVALRIGTGKQVWRAEPPAPTCSWGTRSCLAAQSQAVSAIPGVVFSGSQDGHLRAYAAGDGHVIWDFDTGQSFPTVNGVPAAGGSLDNGGATIAGGMLYVNSGYGRILGQPGNLLLAFTVEP